MIATTILAIGAIFLTACDESGSNLTYTCANGTAADGTVTDGTTVEGREKCTACNGGFRLHNEQCVPTKYTCDHGTPPQGKPSGNVDEARCESCDNDYTKQGNACVRAGAYFCENGTAQSGATSSGQAEHLCIRCFQGYKKLDNNTCARTEYICNNGTPTGGNPQTGNEDVESCQSCQTGYTITADNRCIQTQTYGYVCANGTPAGGNAPAANINKCQSCHGGFKKSGDDCVATQYTCSNGSPVTGSKPAGNQDEEQCGICNCGFTLSGTSCNTTTLTVGDTNAVTCAITQETAFNVNLGTPVDGLWPVYQYKLGTNVELVSVSEGTTDVAQRRYRTACPVGYDVTVDIDLSDGDNATDDVICEDGFTLLAPIAEGVYHLAVRPTSGNTSATLDLRVKDTGLTQIPYGAGTQVGPTFTRSWYYMPVPVGQAIPHVQAVSHEASGISTTFETRILLLADPLNKPTNADAVLLSIGGISIGTLINFGGTMEPYTPTYSTTRAIELVQIKNAGSNSLPDRFTVRFCNDSNNDNNCD